MGGGISGTDTRHLLTDEKLRASAVNIADAGEREYSHDSQLVTLAGDTTILTPAAGKSVRLWWVYALNDPASLAPRLVTIKIGSSVHSITYGVSKRQKFTGAVNDALIVNLDGAGSVAFTAIYEEV
jgi:hypothetical protein